MKFLKSLFGGNAEKYEDKADELRLDFEYRDSAYYYQRALDALEDGEEEAKARLGTKMREVRRQAFAQLLEEVSELIRTQALDIAGERLEIAENFVDDETSRTELERRQEELAELSGEPPPAVDSPDLVTGADEELLELAMAGYDDDDKTRAIKLGEPFHRAYEACQEEKWSEALSRLEEILESTPDEPVVLELAATAAEFLGEPTAAIDYFNRVQEISPFRSNTVAGLVSLYRREGQPAEVRNLLSRAVTEVPVQANLSEPWIQIHLEYALALSEDGHHNESASTILALTGARHADRAGLFFNLAGVMERAGRDEEARQALERAIEAAPRRAMFLERLADFLVQRNLELETALQLLVSANEVETTGGGSSMLGGGASKATQSPNRARYLYKIAKVYFLKGDDSEAERIITTGLAVSRDPEVTGALESLREEVRAGGSAE